MPKASALQTEIESPTPPPPDKVVEGSPSVAVSAPVESPKPSPAPTMGRDAMLEVLVENTPVALAMFDAEMRYLVANRQWITDFGLQDEMPLLGRSQFEVFPNLHPGWRSVYDRALQGHVVRSENDVTEGPDGAPMVFRWEVRPWRRMEDASVGGLMVTCERFAPVGLQSMPLASGKVDAEVESLPLALPNCDFPVLTLDSHGIIQQANDSVHQLVLARGLREGTSHFWDVFAHSLPLTELRRDTVQAITATLKGDSPGPITLKVKLPDDAADRSVIWAFSRSASSDGQSRVLLVGMLQEEGGASLADVVSKQEQQRLEAQITIAKHELDLLNSLDEIYKLREQRHQAVLDALPCGLFVLDERGKPTTHNAQIRKLFGHELKSGDAVEDWLMQACTSDSHREEVARVWQESIWRRQLTKIISLSTADGLLKDFELRPAPLPGNGLLLTIHDVTDPCRLEEMLRAIEAKFRSVLQEAPTATVLTDALGGIFEVNPAAERLLGHSKGELRRTGMDDWLSPECIKIRQEEVQLLSKGKRPRALLPVLLRMAKDKDYHPTTLRMAGIYDGEGKLHAVVHFFDVLVATVPNAPSTVTAPPPPPPPAPAVVEPPAPSAASLLETVQLERECLLLSELQQRINSCLQFVASTLHPKEAELSNEQAVQALRSGQSRLQAVTALQQLLYAAVLGDGGSLQEFTAVLIERLRQCFDLSEQRVSISLELQEDAQLNDRWGPPLALLLLEALANACRHAFPDQKQGKIEVQFLCDAKDAFLSVRDDGVGPGPDFDSSQGAGLKTQHTLAEELLHGQMSLKGLDDGGMLFELHFPIKSIDS